MGAAWREPKDRDLDKVCDMVGQVKALGLETCATLGMLTRAQALRLKASGLDYYNHNLDTSPDYYGAIITTRTYQERLDTLEHVRAKERAFAALQDLDRQRGTSPETSNLLDLYRSFQGPIAELLDNTREAFLPVDPVQPGSLALGRT